MPHRLGAFYCDLVGGCRNRRSPGSRAGGGSGVVARRLANPERSCLCCNAGSLHCTELFCSLFVSFKNCFLVCSESAVPQRAMDRLS